MFALIIKSAGRHRGISPVSSLLFLFLLTLFLIPFRAESKINSTDPDSTKQQYDLFDPRNPDCPCHAAQRQAEEEYKKQQAQNAANGTNQNSDANKNENPGNSGNTQNNTQGNTNVNSKKVSTASPGISSKHYSQSNKNFRQLNKWLKKMNRKMGAKNNGTKKGKRRLASCFHFN